MNDHLPFPADGYRTGWTTWEGDHREELSVRWENEGWTVTGTVGREQIEYVLRLTPYWHVSQFLLFRDLPEPDLWLGTDGHGRWGEVNGAHRPDLDGCHDLALDVTPFTVSLPIRRLPVGVGDEHRIPVAFVDVETLGIEQVDVGYHRSGERRWTVSRTTGSGARIDLELEVDEYGLVLDVPGAFRRV